MAQGYIVSEPRKELVGGGRNAKYVLECTELYLGNKGIQKIRGFEDFINLEYLCLHGNRLKKINKLEANFRLKVLSAQDNQICTLKGSLSELKNLEQLDISNNELRDLAKLLPVLQRFQFLTHLNLKGNPCCEEPDYRLQVVYAMPRLRVLDQHVIMEAERIKAKANIGGDVAMLTVAFGKRTPPRDLQYVPERSRLEEELVKEAARVRDIQVVREREEELKLFSHNPHPDIPRGKSLPPNAGTIRAMAEYHGTSAQTSSTKSGELTETGGGAPLHRKSGQFHSNSDSESPYQPRDVFVMYSSRAAPSELTLAGVTLTKPPPGGIGFERRKYERFVTQKAAGTLGRWELSKETIKM